ncbi:hypothetical protein FOH24_07785 [Acetobacter tropicalis]|uniref:Uncharacterized protein n=1 Tax=Acetobacter tropicalis TaxID=104102 RepID=A0A094YIP5_9PROT|nr:hypothetical protein [Acetobacter tropicalis]KAA8384055.1 hypothetical protein FOH22_15440 [Acetobacter tropicalis]KAA8391270.1 hypothetical protein FOH24_07785 [Acetobacter tropicalis]KGB21905.1 hypothetical protein AtDm6_2671 [Acetobacter tropicalis]MDO8173254.1 hypothetical protein [Acetobacter tropicalis]
MISLSLDGPTADVPLALVADLKADLEVTDSSNDLRLERLLLTASSMVLAYIGRPILSGEWTEEFRLSPSERIEEIVLGVVPVTEIKTVSHNGTGWSADQVADLILDKRAGLLSLPLKRHPFWRAGLYGITFQAGYVPPSVDANSVVQPGTLPRVISQAALMTASALFLGSSRDPNMKSETVQGVGSTTWNSASGTGGMPQAAADLLDNFRGELM